MNAVRGNIKGTCDRPRQAAITCTNLSTDELSTLIGQQKALTIVVATAGLRIDTSRPSIRGAVASWDRSHRAADARFGDETRVGEARRMATIAVEAFRSR
jgi:hypothetical protein